MKGVVRNVGGLGYPATRQKWPQGRVEAGVEFPVTPSPARPRAARKPAVGHAQQAACSMHGNGLASVAEYDPTSPIIMTASPAAAPASADQPPQEAGEANKEVDRDE